MDKPFCSKAVTYAYYQSTKLTLFKEYYMYTPDDLFKSLKYFSVYKLIQN